MKILILKPNDLGDVIQALPVLRLIKLHQPRSEVFWWLNQELSPLLVTNDAGPMHIAAALKRPFVSIFGPTEPRRTGPLHQLEGVLRDPPDCAPCMKPWCSSPIPLECLHRITPARVLAAVETRLAGPPNCHLHPHLSGLD
jgi:ADP-heptose:LPS heptosyltransferase